MQGIKQFLINAALDLRTYLTLGSVIFAFIAFRRHRKKKLAYAIISNASVSSVNPEYKDRVKILLDDNLVEDVSLVEVCITNIGNDAIKPGDYVAPILLDFGEKATILSAVISKKLPDHLPAKVTHDGTKVALEPLLLNQKSSVTIKTLVSKGKKIPVITSLIVDVDNLKDQTDIIKSDVGIVFGIGAVVFLSTVIAAAELFALRAQGLLSFSFTPGKWAIIGLIFFLPPPAIICLIVFVVTGTEILSRALYHAIRGTKLRSDI